MELKGKVALVTGPAKGMGRAITETLAQAGADLALAARDVEAVKDVAEAVRSLGRTAIVVKADVTNETDVRAMLDQTLKAFGARLDILVNVAGVTGPIETPVWEIEARDFESVLQSNIVGTFLPMKYALPTMIAQRYGKIVNISGTSGLRGYRYRAAYSASKWSVRGLTKTAALDVGEYNINVNAVCPGIVSSPRMDKLCEEKARKRGWTFEQVYDEYVQDMALRRVTEGQDIANAVLFLVSDRSRQITGQHIAVDGGWDV